MTKTALISGGTKGTGKATALEEHRHGFTAAMSALIAEFNAYLERDHTDPVADSVSYQQFTLWLSESELEEMINEVRSAIMSRVKNEPASGRTRHLLSTILFPIEEPQQP
jgi:NAD(P)-dependent dehydrogenase (short-subunit alcohol dehydrogenase family)